MKNTTITILAALIAKNYYWPADHSEPLVAGLWVAVAVVYGVRALVGENR